MRVLHLTFHYGTALDIQYIFTKLGFEVTVMNTLLNWPYKITKEIAEQKWTEHKEYFQSFDYIITSDTAGLSYPFLIHIHELRPKLIVWICNRFNIVMEDQDEFVKLFRDNQDNMICIPYTAYETVWCKRHGIELKYNVIHPLGRHEDVCMFQENLIIQYKPLDVSSMFLPKNETIFMQSYHNNYLMKHFLTNAGLSVAIGRHTNNNELKSYKCIVAFPDAHSKIFYLEAIQCGIVVCLPSLKFLKTLVQYGDYGFTSKHCFDNGSLDICEYLNYLDCFVIFDSIEHLIYLLQKNDFEDVKQRMKSKRDIIHDDILGRWRKALTVTFMSHCDHKILPEMCQ